MIKSSGEKTHILTASKTLETERTGRHVVFNVQFCSGKSPEC